ncbi:MAG: DMT family transporter [Burkholderiaceae bacterium]|nr:DMT family transporter [Burkholderiaceae bacterium]
MGRLSAFACLALSMTLVGAYTALSKPLSAAIPVFLLLWLRFAIGGLAMPHWLKKPADEAPLARRTHALLFLESFLGNFLFSICMLFGVSMTSALSAGVIMAAIPATVAVLSWIFLRERIGGRVWLAIACAVCGVALLAWSKQAGTPTAAGSHPLLGNILVFCSVVCEAAYAVIGKALTGKLSPRRITSLMNLWGFALSTPLGLYAAWHFEFAALAPASWLLLLFYALAASVWTVWLWMTGLKRIPANLAGVFTVMLPISASTVAVLVLHESLSATRLLALAIASLGVVLATLPNGRAAAQTSTTNIH